MRQIFKIFILSIFFLTIYFFLFWSGIIKYLALGSSYYFGDYELFKNALSCVNKGLSPYNGPPELNCKGYNYGYVLLVLMPFKDFIVNTNEFTLPIFLTTIFIIFSVQILNPKNYFQFFVCLLALLNPATSSTLLRQRELRDDKASCPSRCGPVRCKKKKNVEFTTF